MRIINRMISNIRENRKIYQRAWNYENKKYPYGMILPDCVCLCIRLCSVWFSHYYFRLDQEMLHYSIAHTFHRSQKISK